MMPPLFYSKTHPIYFSLLLLTRDRDGHRLVIDLCKELASDGPEGFEWWSRVLQDDEDIDMGSVNAGMDLR